MNILANITIVFYVPPNNGTSCFVPCREVVVKNVSRDLGQLFLGRLSECPLSEVALYIPTHTNIWGLTAGIPVCDIVCQICLQWWKANGTHLKSVLLKGTFGKYIRFSPDFQTFITIDNAGLLYILKSLS